MALITRYFDASGAGSADGTTWANRAALLSGGSWSTVITGFDFSGSDALRCLINGNITVTQVLTSTLFANPPTQLNRLYLVGCDGSGTELSVPDPDWISPMPAWSASSLPVLTADSSTTSIVSMNYANFRLLKVVGTTTSVSYLVQNATMRVEWCHIELGGGNASSAAVWNAMCLNSVITVTAGTFAYAVYQPNVHNCRITATSKGTAGTRHGAQMNAANMLVDDCTISGFAGDGVNMTSSSGGGVVKRCTIRDCDGDGIEVKRYYNVISHNMITGCGGYAINATENYSQNISNNRSRDNTSGLGDGTWYNTPNSGNYTVDSDDATEYVNSGGGDYRIKHGATIWDMGFGAGRQDPSGGGGGSIMRHPGMEGGMNG